MTLHAGIVASGVNNAGLPNPVLSYNFTETGTSATDRTGQARNGALLRAATPTDLHSSGQLLFTSSQQDKLEYTPASLPTGAASVALKLIVGAASAKGALWSYMNASNTSGFNLFVNTSIGAVVRGASAAAVMNPAGSPLVNNTTYQIALTYDGATSRVYIDTVQVASSTTATGNLNLTAAKKFVIGYQADDPGVIPIAGFRVDDVRFWHIALTPAQVSLAAATPVT